METHDIQQLANKVKVAREQAVLGQYDQSIENFKNSFFILTKHTSSQKKQDDIYLSERWQQLQDSLTKEYSLVCAMHRDLLQLQDSNSMIDESFYEIPYFGNQGQSRGGVEDRPLPTQKKSNNLGDPGKQSARERANNYAKKSGSSYAYRPPSSQVNRNNPAQPQLNRRQSGMQPSTDPGEHFGGLKPFEHHQLPDEGKDHYKNFANQRGGNGYDNQDAHPNNQNYDQDSYPSHQVYGGGQQRQQMDQPQAPKDPDIWEPPAPPKKQNQWGNNPQPKRAQPSKALGFNKEVRGGGGPKAAPPKASPVPKAAAASRGAAASKAGKDRDYDKPWAVPKKEKKEEPTTYLEHCFPSGAGPDYELIQSMENEVLDRSPGVGFDDIADLDETKRLLKEAVLLPILMPDFFKGIRRPWKGVCLFGPPGTGKTLLAKAVATEGGTTFFNIKASSLASKWRGESEKMVRILFEMARFYGPSTIFFDEMDAIAGSRGDGGSDANRRVLSELLQQMDGVAGAANPSANDGQDKDEAQKNVMVLAATNRPWDLDEAIRRRLEKRIYIPLPTPEGRRQMFQINLKGVNLAPGVDFEHLVANTDGYSGADLTNVCREASFMPMREIEGLSLDEIRNLKDTLKDKPLTMEYFNKAIIATQRSVGSESLAKFKEWMDQFGAS